MQSNPTPISGKSYGKPLKNQKIDTYFVSSNSLIFPQNWKKSKIVFSDEAAEIWLTTTRLGVGSVGTWR
jgi:hypothetical protein